MADLPPGLEVATVEEALALLQRGEPLTDVHLRAILRMQQEREAARGPALARVAFAMGAGGLSPTIEIATGCIDLAARICTWPVYGEAIPREGWAWNAQLAWQLADSVPPDDRHAVAYAYVPPHARESALWQLGEALSAQGIEPDPDTAQACLDMAAQMLGGMPAGEWETLAMVAYDEGMALRARQEAAQAAGAAGAAGQGAN